MRFWAQNLSDMHRTPKSFCAFQLALTLCELEELRALLLDKLFEREIRAALYLDLYKAAPFSFLLCVFRHKVFAVAALFYILLLVVSPRLLLLSSQQYFFAFFHMNQLL